MGEPEHPRDRPSLTLADLERWEAGGAAWRAVELDGDRAVIELCSCVGEPVDLLAGVSAELVAYVRARGLRSDAP